MSFRQRCSASDDAYKLLRQKGATAAWAEIANEVEDNRVAIEAARLKLANAVLANAQEDSRDPEALKNAALFALVRDEGKI